MTKQERNSTDVPKDKSIGTDKPDTEQLEGSEEKSNPQIKKIHEYEKRITELEQALRTAKKNENEAMLRARAEIENSRRRMNQEVEKIHKFALEKFANELLPVIDNLERALDAANKDGSSIKTMIEGLELTLKTFLNTVKKFGIEQINPANETLNPELHEAISVVESPDHQPGYVINAIQKGYTLNGRLLRPAMVVVAK